MPEKKKKKIEVGPSEVDLKALSVEDGLHNENLMF